MTRSDIPSSQQEDARQGSAQSAEAPAGCSAPGPQAGVAMERTRSQWFRPLGLGGQILVLWLVVLVTLAVTVAGVGLWALGHREQQEARERLVQGASLAALLVARAARAGRGVGAAGRGRPGGIRAEWVALLRRVQRLSQAEELMVVAEPGPRIRLGHSPLEMDPRQDSDLAAALRGARLPVRQRTIEGEMWVVLYRTVLLPGGKRAALRLAVRPALVGADRLGRARQAILWIVLLDGLLALVVGGLFLRRRLLRPLARMEQASARVAAGDPTARIPLCGSSALDPLARRFNDMLERLAAKDRRLLSQVEALAQKQQELDQSWEVLLRSAKLASVGRLAAGVAHELGNPLSSLFGYLELLEAEGVDGARRADLVGRVRAELTRMDETIRALLDSARPGDDRVVCVDLQEAVTRAADLAKHERRLRDVDIHVRLSEVPQVAASRRIDQVFVNLLLNAGDALRGQGRVDVWAEVEDEEVCVLVADNGPGIPETLRKSLFDPFVTSKAPGEGTGLGLSVSQSIVEASGGRLRLSSPQPECGAQFEIWLPRWRGVAGKDRSAPKARSSDDPGVETPQRLASLGSHSATVQGPEGLGENPKVPEDRS